MSSATLRVPRPGSLLPLQTHTLYFSSADPVFFVQAHNTRFSSHSHRFPLGLVLAAVRMAQTVRLETPYYGHIRDLEFPCKQSLSGQLFFLVATGINMRDPRARPDML